MNTSPNCGNYKKNCKFNDVDAEILSQLIQHCQSNRLRRRALRETDKKLSDILAIGRSLEIADRQADTIETKANDVRAIRRKAVRVEHRPRKHDDNRRDEHLTHPNYRPRRDEKRNQPPPRYQSHHRRTDSKTTTRSCRRCGGNFPHTDTCPAMGKTCNYCKKPNHFAKVCRNRKHTSVHEITASKHTGSSYSSEDDFCYAVKDSKRKTPVAKVRINDVDVNIMVDTGASVNILDEGTYGNIGNPKLTTRKPVRLMPYGGGPALTVIGRCTVTVETRREIQCHDFHVVKNGNGALLGYKTATDLGLIQFINKVTEATSTHPNLFRGIGKLKDVTVKLHVDESVEPVALK